MICILPSRTQEKGNNVEVNFYRPLALKSVHKKKFRETNLSSYISETTHAAYVQDNRPRSCRIFNIKGGEPPNQSIEKLL